MKITIALTAVVMMLASSGCSSKVVVPPSTVLPAAQGETRLGKDDNGNTEVHLRVRHFAPAENLSPAKQVYVVWLETPENQRFNLGQLRINNDREGDLRAITAFKHFRLLVTAEDSPTTTQPTGQAVLVTGPLEVK